MPQTFPNQRMVRVHRERAKTDFLGIKNENWMYASRDLGAHALRLYLYLAANADGYNLALSPADIRQRIGMPTSTYRDQFLVLVDKGYLVPNSSNGYDFYELPQARHAILQVEQCESRGYDFENNTLCGQPITADIPKVAAQDREIYNRENETNNGINTQSDLPLAETIQAPKVKEVVIKRPTIKEKEQTTPILKVKQGVFEF